MTGPEHYASAEADLDNAARADGRGRQDDVAYWLDSAQVHATLALAAATAMSYAPDNPMDLDAWYEAAATKQAGTETPR